MNYLTLVITFFIISHFPSRSSGWGCPEKVVAMRKLPLEKFLGTWYEFKYKNRVYDETIGRCTTLQFSQNKVSTDVIDITITDRIRYNDVVNHGQLQQLSPDDKSGLFMLTYYFRKRSPITHKKKTKVATGVFKVLGTDGECWAVVYSCEESFFLSDEQTSVLIKDRDFKCVTKEKSGHIEDVLSEVGLDFNSMKANDQLGCSPVDPPE